MRGTVPSSRLTFLWRKKVTDQVSVSESQGGIRRPVAAQILGEVRLPLYIARDVFVCVTGEGSVLLDLKRDKYLGLGRSETQLLAAAIEAWPKPMWIDSVETVQVDKGDLQTLLATLVEAGVLSGDAEGGSAERRPMVDMKVDWISIGDEMEVESRVTVKNAVNFLMAFLEARMSLAFRPFAATVNHVRIRKAARGRDFEVCHALQVAGMVDVFRRLRPFVFAPENRCLLHALTLVNFLARYDFYPEWVLGVSTQPWGAHSWVQWGNFLLDSNPEKVCSFTPILVV